jgi:hypothetical protein
MRPGNITKLLILSFAVKISYLIFAWLIAGNSSILSVNGYSSIIQRNDSGWYEKIATGWYPRITDKTELGYSNGADFRQSEWAFFPFYPAMNRISIKLLKMDFDTSGLIISILFSTLAFAGFFLFCKLYLKEAGPAFYCSLVFLLFPFHYYFSMMLTEAVYFFFLIFSFISIHQRKYLVIPLLVVPLVLVRPNGILCLVPLFIYFMEREDILNGKHLRSGMLLTRGKFLPALLLLSGPAAFIAFGFYQKHMTGHFFAFSIAQAGWYRGFMLPFLAFFRRGDFATQFNSVYSILVIILAALSWKRFPLSLNLFVWISLLVPLCSGSVTSMPRFISVIFPLSMIIGQWLYVTKLKYYILGLLFFLQLFVFYFWLTGDTFSF